ncbi:MAG: ATP-dependent DNA helicase RecG [Chloroflexota bacterium]|nr:ATP-dependent DNA helicase RecG [Chloroflexota bacterium]
MRPAYDPSTVVQRVLALERQQGFLDRAAVGGLSQFVQQQLKRAGDPPPDPLLAAASLLQDYGGADRRKRERAVADALHVLLTGSAPSAMDLSTTALAQAPAAPPPIDTAVPADLPRSVAPSNPDQPELSSVHSAENLDQDLASLKGIRKPMPEALERMGVATVRDLLYHFPRTHYDYADTSSISRLRLGEKITLVGVIRDVRVNRTARNVAITTATISDDTGTIAVRWFNQPYLQKSLPVGKRIAISGEPDVFNGRFTFAPRDYELIEDVELTHTARLVPIYPLTKGLFQRSLRSCIRRIVDEYAGALEDYLPAPVRGQFDLLDLARAVDQYHFPADERHKAQAERRLAFDELFLIQLGLLMRKKDWQQYDPAVAVPVDAALQERFRASLPFSLTGAQRRVLAGILEDMQRPQPMSRLLQGDVGSGKTVVAAAALLQIAAVGRQGVLMAPTEILAEQHFRTLSQLLAPFGVRCELLIGSTTKAQRRVVNAGSADGSIPVLVGTHALIQENVEFRQLGLAITDEQHRFGVEQRAALRLKGLHPHTLAMTATPIPRTLAMTIYGDLDVSSLDEMPAGRLPVATTWCRKPFEAYAVIREEVQQGRQAFVVCPVIEDTADSDMRSVIAEHQQLQSLTFPDLTVGLLHGRMKPAEKEKTLASFRAGEYQVLVATSVVEVGIDVPNATVMVIRDAHRFGLAQLHQFRGRVGRGSEQAYCILLSASEGDQARERLEALTATDNGFELAEEDLRLRGPGEFWGLRQSGLPALRVAKLGDVATIEDARRAAQQVLAEDPELAGADNELLSGQVTRFWRDTADLS